MSERRPFGLWTLVVAVAWAAGTILAIVTIWRLWSSVPR
jgi:hypothetical protein